MDSLLQATLPLGRVEDEVDTYGVLVLASRVSGLSNVATSSKVAELSDAGISEQVTRHTPVDETKPLVVGDWLSDKDILAWLNHNLCHNEVGEPQAWIAAVTYIVSRVNIMRK